MHVCVCARVRVRACVRACMHAFERACMCLCVYVHKQACNTTSTPWSTFIILPKWQNYQRRHTSLHPPPCLVLQSPSIQSPPDTSCIIIIWMLGINVCHPISVSFTSISNTSSYFPPPSSFRHSTATSPCVWNRKLNLCHLFMQGINLDQRSILRVAIKSPPFWAHIFFPRDVIKTDIWTTASRNYTNNLCCLDCYNLPANIWPRSQL